MTETYNKDLKIVIFGSKKNIEEAKNALDAVKHLLTGMEGADRLHIQEAIDGANIKAHILYDGNTVYGYKKLAAEIKRMKKSGSIEKMTNAMYEFLMNFDIAHYDKGGFIYYYNGSYQKLLEGIRWEVDRIPAWQTDVKRIADDLY